jgi:hypothetical protein
MFKPTTADRSDRDRTRAGPERDSPTPRTVDDSYALHDSIALCERIPHVPPLVPLALIPCAAHRHGRRCNHPAHRFCRSEQ